MQVRPIHMYKVPTEYPDGMWYSYIHAHAKYNEKLTNRGPATAVQPDIMVILYRVYPMLRFVLWLLLKRSINKKKKINKENLKKRTLFRHWSE